MSVIVNIDNNVVVTNEYIDNYNSIRKLDSIDIYGSQNVHIKDCILDFKSYTKDAFKRVFTNKNINFEGCTIFLNKSHAPAELLNIADKNKIHVFGYWEYLLANNENNLSQLQESELSKISFKGRDLRGVTLPVNKELFNLLKDGCLAKTKLPQINLTKYNIANVDFSDCIFHEYSVLSQQFFDRSKSSALLGCTLPIVDFNDFDTKGVMFQFVKFHKKTIFPERDTFFSELKLLYGCSMPPVDYRMYNFDNVDVSYCKFPEKSLLPISDSLYSQVNRFSFPKKYFKIFDILPFKKLDVEETLFNYGKFLTEEQQILLYLKYKKK